MRGFHRGGEGNRAKALRVAHLFPATAKAGISRQPLPPPGGRSKAVTVECMGCVMLYSTVGSIRSILRVGGLPTKIGLELF